MSAFRYAFAPGVKRMNPPVAKDRCATLACLSTTMISGLSISPFPQAGIRSPLPGSQRRSMNTLASYRVVLSIGAARSRCRNLRYLLAWQPEVRKNTTGLNAVDRDFRRAVNTDCTRTAFIAHAKEIEDILMKGDNFLPFTSLRRSPGPSCPLGFRLWRSSTLQLHPYRTDRPGYRCR